MKSVTRAINAISTTRTRLRLFTMFAFLGLLVSSTETSAQLVIDGNPADWGAYLSNPSTTVKARLVDPIDNTDNIWTQGTSDPSLVQDWRWATNGSNDKNNIQNAGFALIGTKVYFFADRHANNGDAAVGFWLLQSPVAQVAGGTFSGVHTDGDILLISHFVNGGSVADIKAYKWVGSNPGALDQNPIPLNIANLYAAVNATTTPASPWPYTPKSGPANVYPTNTFFEGFVDLSAVGIEISVCLGSFVAETRNSQSVTASLEDLVIGRFGAQPITQQLTGSSICQSAPGTGTITMAGSEVGVSYQLRRVSDNGNVQVPQPGTGGPITWINVPAGTYYVRGTNTTSLCFEDIGNPTTVVEIPSPTVTVNSPSRCADGPAVTITATPNPAGTYTYQWSVPQGATNPGNVPSFSATVGGVYTVTITDANTCTGSGSGTLTVNPVPDVNDPADQVICNGASTAAVSFTSSVPGTTFNWTNDQPSIGLAANGSGNIASFVGVNNTNAPIVATITVTPSTIHCTGAAITFTITVNPTPFVDQPGNQTECNGSPTTPIVFTGSAGAYNWTNSNTAIGLAANGTGNIPSFTATNNTAAPITGTITVTPVYQAGQTTCTGSSKSFTITVNPTGQVDQPANQVVCNGGMTTTVTFSGTATSYSWTNDNTSIGLAANGTGNIAAFSAINNGTTPAVANITVTPISTIGGISCPGPTKTFTITVNPAGQVNQVGNQVICAGAGTTAIVFSTGNSGGTTTYTWTNSNPAIGLAASSGGNATGIPSFVGTNNTNAPISGTITVVPTFTNGGVSCPGASISFTITVNPNGQVNAIGNQVVCNGASTTAVVFSTANTGGTTTYTWTNSNPAIGLAASSGGNATGIPSFTATNNTNAPISGTITVIPTFTNGGTSCPGASTSFTITVNPNGQVNQVGNQVVCNGASTTAVVFSTNNTGGTTTYTWTNSNPAIGLPASSGGNATGIPSFTATNGTTAPISGTITVTPTFTNGGTSCPGASTSFTITVNPNGQVNAIGNQVVCNGASTTAVVFSTANTGGTTTYTWTNSNPAIGLAASSGGNATGIPSFTATNNTNAPISGTITVTPTFTNGGTSCPGASTSFIITVNPGGQVNQVGNQVVCNGASTTAVVFSTNNTGGTTTYTWTNSNPAIGLAASSGGNATGIPSFTATNNTNAPISGTITVTPTFTNGGTSCPGASTSFTITVNPNGQVNAIGNQVICNGASTTAVVFGTVNTGGTTTYTWTNSNPAIGLAASSGGNATGIPSFTATNGTNAPISGTITVTPTFTNGGTSCPGASTSFTITVNPNGQVNAIGNQVVCNGASTTAVVFSTVNTGGTTTYTWTNSNPAIGLAASSGGNATGIPSFTATNGTTAPISGTITVTPTFTNGGTSCPGASTSFTITVNPNGQVNQIGNQVVCNGASTTAVVFSTVNTGGTTTYTWTNSNPAIGLAASSGGNATGIPSFTATNNTTSPITGTITVTPTFTNGGTSCPGASTSFTITVNPNGQVNAIGNQVVCNGASTTAVVFSTVNTGGTTTYTWTNSNPAIGLAASSGGNATGIPSFTATNGTTAPISGTITVTPTFTNGGTSCPGASTSFTITVNPNGQVNAIGNQVVCNGASTTAVVFSTVNTGGTTTYTWTNSNPAIGLAASSGGNATGIPSFTATNGTTAPISGTITVTPTFTNGGTSCPGASTSFTITVNPNGQVNQIGNQVVCNGASTTAVVFSTVNTGGTTTYTWTNSNPAIGLAASSGGNATGIPSFTATNNTTSPISGTITVTPTFTNGGTSCPGASTSFTITVNPNGQVNAIGNQVVCNGASTTAVVFSTVNTGGTTTYTWTNSNPAIGLAASSGGNATGIPSFTATNNTNAPISGTITVTPTFTNGGTSCPGQSVSFTITVNPTPTANQVDNRIHCHNDQAPAIIFAGPVAGTTYSWTSSANVGFGLAGNGDIPAYTAVNTTNDPIVATVTVTPAANDCVGPTMSFTVTVNPIPATVASNSGPLCVGGTLNLFAANSLPGATYSWTGPDNFTSNVQNPPAITNVQLVNAGDYTVTVSLNGCSSQSTTTVVINENPIIYILSGTNYCAGDPNKGTATLSGSQTGKTYTIYDDTNNPVPGQPVLPGTGNPLSWTVLNAGGYAVRAQGELPTNCYNFTNPITIVENPLPDPQAVDTSVCVDQCIDLVATPAGGTWSGVGVNGSQFCATGLQPGDYPVTYTVTNENNCTNSITILVTVKICVEGLCTYTQGAYGSAGGTMCNGTYGGISTDSLIYYSITNWGGTLTVGRNTKSVTMTNAQTNRACIVAKLPGGGPSKELAGAYNICNLPANMLQNGKIKNTLLAQTITLGLNLGITSPSLLGDFVLQGGILATAKPLGGCGSNIPTPRTCVYDTVPPYRVIVTNEYEYYEIDPDVVAAIVPINGQKTVRGLFELANDALANTDLQNNKENNVLISKIATAVDRINNAFDECRIFIGWNVPACVPAGPPPNPFVNNTITSRTFATEEAAAKINVSTYPNPFSDRVKFNIDSKVSGDAVLEVYSLMGAKLAVIYKGYIFAGRNQVVEYSVPPMNRTNLIYVLRVGDRTITGKLTNIK